MKKKISKTKSKTSKSKSKISKRKSSRKKISKRKNPDIFSNGTKAYQIALATPKIDNNYELAIHAAANWLVDQDESNARYLTHYEGGRTVWATSEGPKTISNKTGEWIRNPFY